MKKHIRGFSLLELLVTLAVAGILLSVAVPNFRRTIQDSRLITQTNTMVGMFSLARSKAVTLGGGNVVSVCPGTVTNHVVTCSGSNWGTTGWVVFSATYSSSSCFTGTKTSIRTYPAIPSSNYVNTSASISSVTFLPTGLLCSPTVATDFYFCDDRKNDYAREVNLTLTGSARASTEAGKKIDGTTAITSC